MAVDTSDFKNGMHIGIDGDPHTILEFQHVKPGKGGAFVRTRMRNLKTGRILERTFRSGEKFESVYVEKMPMQFLYRQGNDAILMDLDSYEQIPVPAATLGDGSKYLKEGTEVTALNANGETLGYELPNFMELEVTEADPGVRGDTVSGGATKPAKLESGATIQVPFHINPGDVIKVDTRTDTYLERVKR